MGIDRCRFEENRNFVKIVNINYFFVSFFFKRGTSRYDKYIDT